ncbi:MAG TPA: hypothetical protein VKP03_01780 [Patescibacteria group bacterium]|nr:hypothetical protein [Patescibacteria group bacterium]
MSKEKLDSFEKRQDRIEYLFDKAWKLIDSNQTNGLQLSYILEEWFNLDRKNWEDRPEDIKFHHLLALFNADSRYEEQRSGQILILMDDEGGDILLGVPGMGRNVN